MSQTVLILVGTMSGTAEMVAEVVADLMEDAGLRARIVRMEKATPDLIAAHPAWLICSSTYGTGEVPDNAKSFQAALEQNKPDLRGRLYGVIALGDSIYPNTYCYGGKTFDDLLTGLGATRVGERLELDGRSKVHPDEAAEDWAPGWIEQLQSVAPQLVQA